MAHSDTQSRILDYIRRTIAAKGYAPSIREICRAVNISSTSTIHAHLDKLEKHGFIKRDPAKPRSIELISKAEGKSCIVPVIERIYPNAVIDDPSHVKEYIALPGHIADGENVVAFYVRDERLKGDGIQPGDCIVIQVGKRPHGAFYALKTEDGEIVLIRSSQILDIEKDRYVSVAYSHRGLTALGAVVGLVRML